MFERINRLFPVWAVLLAVVAAFAPELDAAAVKKMTVAKLRAALAARGLDTKGLKAALQVRLLEAIAS